MYFFKDKLRLYVFESLKWKTKKNRRLIWIEVLNIFPNSSWQHCHKRQCNIQVKWNNRICRVQVKYLERMCRPQWQGHSLLHCSRGSGGHRRDPTFHWGRLGVGRMMWRRLVMVMRCLHFVHLAPPQPWEQEQESGATQSPCWQGGLGRGRIRSSRRGRSWRERGGGN